MGSGEGWREFISVEGVGERENVILENKLDFSSEVEFMGKEKFCYPIQFVAHVFKSLEIGGMRI